MEKHGNGMVHRNENLQAMLHWLSIYSMAMGVGNYAKVNENKLYWCWWVMDWW